ncbi:Ig-like domain-containing protein, partial [Bacteroidia bacterium]|nr:Ig-like domain-containing protein [Bacteroidia bacterium]
MKYISFLILLLYSCASVQVLDGGQKDISPPIVLKATPDSASTNVTTSTFTFTFDEYIKTNKLNDLLIISPSQKLNPSVSIKGKKVIIKILDSLLNNTTYTFQFNGSIADINENNPLTDYRYIFTTGDRIDTLRHSGIVKNLTTNELCNNCNIHLYKLFDDSLILKSKPDYLAKTNESGIFSFTNLPNSTFNQIAIEDKNKNLLLDKEEFVSLSSTVNTTNTYSDTTYIFPSLNTDKLKAVFTKTRTPGYILFKTNKPVLT